MVENVCIYHDKCLDGFAAAWAVRSYAKRKNNLDKWQFIPSTYGMQIPEDVTGKHVYLVDFSYKKSQMYKLLKMAASVTILDHHKTALAEVGDLVADGTIKGVLDMERSGCVIAWEYFNAPVLKPELFFHIQDRDLWQFKSSRTKKVISALEVHPRSFEAWDELLINNPKLLDTLETEGDIINKVRMYQMGMLVPQQYPMCIGGYVVATINAPHFLASDIGNVLAKRSPYLFGATYYDTPDQRLFSLRSSEKGLDVSEIAAIYGGGGHKHAAGFTISKKWQGEPMPKISEVA